jgi:transposase-like protein
VRYAETGSRIVLKATIARRFKTLSNEIVQVHPRAPINFEWTEQRELAAALVAQGDVPVNEIAERCGITRDCLWQWKKSHVFQIRVAEHLQHVRDELLSVGVAAKEARISALQDRHLRLQRIIEERAEAAMADPDSRDVPGAASGLLVRKVRVTGSGRTAERVVEWVLDDSVLKEIRAVEEHIAKELGEWQPSIAVNVDNKVVTFPDGSFSMGKKMYAGIDLDRFING